MPGNKQRTRYRRKRTGVFTGKRKQDVLSEEIGGHVALGHTTPSNAALAHSPPKKNRSEEKINENCPLIIKQNEAVVTRRKALDLGMHSQGKTTVQSYGNHVVSSSCLEEGFLSAVVCASCRSPKGKLVLMQDNSKRIGLHETFSLKCSNCNEESTFETGNRVHNGRTKVNVRFIQAGLLTGIGVTGLQKFCSTLDLPSPVSSKAYNATVKEIQMSVDKECQKSLESASLKLKKLMKASDPNCSGLNVKEDIFPVTVSVDGTWQKRYGFSSLLGVLFVISMDTGEVLDYEVKSKVCFQCRSRNLWPRDSKKYLDCYKSHKPFCSIDHTQSAEAMEKEAAVDIFRRSIPKLGLKYTTYVGDGDSSSFGEVSDAMFKQFGEEYLVLKEDCVGHIQKRMGTNLRKYKTQKKGSKLADGSSVGGRGRLTDAVIDGFLNYYGNAIRQHSQDMNAMQDAVWAIFYHSILGKNETFVQQHRFCPKGQDSWCKFQCDLATKTNTYSDKKCLPSVFREELRPIFERLSSKTLLQRCLKGFTQNQNEALNNSLWARCPKRVFVGKTKLENAVGAAVLLWNRGAASMGSVLERVGVQELGLNTAAGYRSENKARIESMAVKCSSSYRKRRKQLRQERKKRNVIRCFLHFRWFCCWQNCRNKKKMFNKCYTKESDKVNKEGDIINICFVDESDVIVKMHEKRGKQNKLYSSK